MNEEFSSEQIRLYQALRSQFNDAHGYMPSMDSPVTFSEKMFWRKLFDRNPILPILVDKLNCRKFIIHRLGRRLAKTCLPRLLLKTKDPEQLKNLSPSNHAVIKPTHLSGRYYIWGGAKTFSIESIIKEAKKWLTLSHGEGVLEWAYTEVCPMIIVEEFIHNKGVRAREMSFHMFNGDCWFIEEYSNIDTHRGGEQDQGMRIFYDPDWNELPFEIGEYKRLSPQQKPNNIREMHEIAKQLSHGISYLRVDLYHTSSSIFVGELTPYTGSGLDLFRPLEWDEIFGKPWVIAPKHLQFARSFNAIPMPEQKIQPDQKYFPNPEHLKRLSVEQNISYFSDSQIHERMLADSVRLDTYARAIKKLLRSSDTVLDIGCGTGILSFLCAKHGVRHVVGIDHSKGMIDIANHIAQSNKITNVEFIHQPLQAYSGEPTTVIIHELMASLIDEENMIETILEARSKHLLKGGAIIPSIIELYAVIVEVLPKYRVPNLASAHFGKVNYSSLETMPELELNPFMIFTPNSFAKRLTKPVPFMTIDLSSDDLDLIPRAAAITSPATKTGQADGICFYFKAYFDKKIFLANDPFSDSYPVSWFNYVYRLKPFQVDKGRKCNMLIRMPSMTLPTRWHVWVYQE